MAKWQWFNRDQQHELTSVAVIGMGRFGQAVAAELMSIGVDVLAIDRDKDVIETVSPTITHAVVADTTREEVLGQLGVDEMPVVVVAIGDSVEASVMTTSILLSMGVPEIWAKAVSEVHGRILTQLGVTHVVYPEKESGRRVAHLLQGAVKDYIDLGDGLAMVRTTPPACVLGTSIKEAHIRRRFGVTVIACKRGDEPWQDVTGEAILSEGDQVLVTGPRAKAENFHRLD